MNKHSRRPSGLLVPAHVQLGKPRAVHCKRERHHVYVGRNPKSLPPSKWGNPFVVGTHGARGECIALYEGWLRENAALFAALDELRGLVLGCWCAPRARAVDAGVCRAADGRARSPESPAAHPAAALLRPAGDGRARRAVGRR
jgi:hypothetical protein